MKAKDFVQITAMAIILVFLAVFVAIGVYNLWHYMT
jgi:hypothetical protein